MKSWEDILKGRFARHAEPGKPGQDEALWNAIETGMTAAPSGAKAAGAAKGVSGVGGAFWFRAVGAAAAMGLITLGALYWPSAEPITPQEGTQVEPSMDAPTPAITALDSEGEEGTPSISEVAAQDAPAESAANTATAVEPASNEPGSHQAYMTMPAVAAMAPEVSVAQSIPAVTQPATDAAPTKDAVAAETVPAEVGAPVATAEVTPADEAHTAGAESAPTATPELAPSAAASDRLPLFLPREEPDGEENVARARSVVGGGLPPVKSPAEVGLEPLPLRGPAWAASPLAQLLPMEAAAIHVEAPFALRTYGGLTLSHFSLKGGASQGVEWPFPH